MAKEKKIVTNLLDDISRARDIIARGNTKEIFNRLALFTKIQQNVRRQMTKYVTDQTHELDFNAEDLNELSTEVFEFIKNWQQKFIYSKLLKDATKTIPVTDELFKEWSAEMGIVFKVHTCLTSFYKEMAYLGVVIYLWSCTNYRRPLGDQLTDLVRSFL